MKKIQLKNKIYNLTGIDYRIFPEKQQKILNQLYSKHAGTYFKIQYYTDVNKQISACYKNQYNVTKLTTISIRIGISYDKTKRVINKRMAQGYIPSNRETFYYHLDKILLKHRKENKYYIAAFPNINGKPETQYLLNGKPISYQELKALNIMQPAFWKHKDKPDFMTIGLDKIINVY